ncbi:5-oxoprolinase subunit PxpB [Halarcobacter sp.]|uniref:5-oxoprolinase subunit PxpB n=1 Tax=Halarcobacter sp. TaxID=2321133 RepID=UPI0029F47BAF|nr:5-oxoprolinase subunit PxpB [Halarcobacter sp.]
MTVEIASVDSVIIYFSNTISKQSSLEVKAAYKVLKEFKGKGLIELIPSYTSLLVTYDIFYYDFESIKSFLNSKLSSLEDYKEDETNIITIDVYYDEEVGFDLQRVAQKSNLSIDEVIELHSSKIYDVYAIGFLPGFAYLASLDERIKTSRLETPRKKIPKGSVAIADTQTAIYPKDSPGGWNILGRTAFELFDKNLKELSPISIESKIKFNPISKEEFLSQGGNI